MQEAEEIFMPAGDCEARLLDHGFNPLLCTRSDGAGVVLQRQARVSIHAPA